MSAQPGETGQIAGRARIANLANILTLLRLVIVPVFLLALFYGGHRSAARVVAWAILQPPAYRSIRRPAGCNYGMAAEFGAFVDPIADKTLIRLGADRIVDARRLAVVGSRC